MNKKHITLTLAFICASLGFNLFTPSLVHADENLNTGTITVEEIDSTPTDQPTEFANPESTDSATPDSTNTPENCLDESGNLIECTTTDLENAIEAGSSTEPEVTCTEGEDCPGENIEEEVEDASDPEVWPLYLSLGVLGFTIIFVIVINLLNRKRQ